MVELFPRRASARLMKRGYFFVNGEEVVVPTQQVVDGDLVTRENQELLVKMHVTLLIHKPAGYISSDIDEYGRPSYKNLLDNYPYAPMLHIAGRLDVDTTGLILASSDGDLVHHIISPKHHLPKTYLVTTRDPVTEAVCKKLSAGVLLDDGYKTLPAQAKMTDSHHLELILIEGKYHQVKRMLIAVGNEVVALQRTSIGPWTLADLGENVYKELGKDEIAVAFSREISIDKTSPDANF